MKRISDSTVGRLSLYLRILREYTGGTTISSEALAGSGMASKVRPP